MKRSKYFLDIFWNWKWGKICVEEWQGDGVLCQTFTKFNILQPPFEWMPRNLALSKWQDFFSAYCSLRTLFALSKSVVDVSPSCSDCHSMQTPSGTYEFMTFCFLAFGRALQPPSVRLLTMYWHSHLSIVNNIKIVAQILQICVQDIS
jgi:hypothetical protein